MGGSFWQKDSLITHIPFELWLIMVFSPVANFEQHPLEYNDVFFLVRICSWSTLKNRKDQLVFFPYTYLPVYVFTDPNESPNLYLSGYRARDPHRAPSLLLLLAPS